LFKPLAQGAYPQAGLQLIEALREYERELARRPDERRRYSYNSRRSEFSLWEVLDEYYDDPLDNQCLQRANWGKIRPTLFVSTYITERHNLVIEVRPTVETGGWHHDMFRLQGQSIGDFRYFPIYTASFSRPSNRVLYIPLGEVTGFQFRQPWDCYVPPLSRHAAERHLLILSVKAKLHQLSLHFDCHIDRELIEFGPEHLVDFRRPPAEQDPDEERAELYSMVHLDHFDPAHWAPQRIREFLKTSSLDVEDLYAFCSDYLVNIPAGDQVSTYAQYLAGSHASRITGADVSELVMCATDKAYRKARMLDELAADTTFAARMKKHRMFDYFCRHFDFTEEQGLSWVIQYQPSALADLGRLSVPALIQHLKNPQTRADAVLVKRLDGLVAEAFETDDSYSWHGLARLHQFLDTQALEYGFASFEDLQTWAKKAAPETWAASKRHAGRVAQQVEKLEAEAQARRTAANEKRKATRAAKKQGAPDVSGAAR
jgi:hypothetical protein